MIASKNSCTYSLYSFTISIYTIKCSPASYAYHSSLGVTASLVDPVTMRLPPHYTLASFFRALEDFFGGGVTIDSRERSLDNLRQTGTVAELTITFQNITNTLWEIITRTPMTRLRFSMRVAYLMARQANGTLPSWTPSLCGSLPTTPWHPFSGLSRTFLGVASPSTPESVPWTICAKRARLLN